MKQVPQTAAIKAKLQSALGPEVDTTNHAVYEAIALNTKPVRKDHPLFKGAVHTPKYLRQMADVANAESRPIHIMHESDMLPIGHTLHSEVRRTGDAHELRTLFFVSPTEKNAIDKVDDGTVDQVSVATRPKVAKCSACNFNYLGPEATSDNFWSRTCPDGHKLGEDAHLVMSDMAQYHEISLVNAGGADGARIVSPGKAKLLSELSLNDTLDALFTLSLAESDLEPLKSETKPMDMDKFVASLTETSGKLAVAESKVADLTKENGELKAKAEAAGKAGELQTSLDAEKKTSAALSDALKKVATKVLVMSGQTDANPDTSDPEKLVALVEEKATGMSAVLAAAGRVKDAVDDADKNKPTFSASAFKAPPRR